MVRVVIQCFLKKPVISTVFKADEQQVTIVFSAFIHPFMMEPPCNLVYLQRKEKASHG